MNDVERFNRWAEGYDRHYLQRLIFEPVQRTLLEVASAVVPSPEGILDVGCGTGRLLRSAAEVFPDARLEGVDAAAEMVRHAQAARDSRITFRVATAESLPFPDASFDLVFSTMTFHHWANQGVAIGEVGRVLTPGGRWLLADFVATGLMKYVRRLFRLRRFPERKVLDPMLAAAGLKVIASHRVRGVGSQIPILVIGR